MSYLPFTRKWPVAVILAFTALVSSVQAQTTPQARLEINELLNFIEHSNCQFVRNGNEYSSSQARAHLEKKLDHLEGKNLINKAEDFIDLAATKSSISGNAYGVRCATGEQLASTWLKTELQSQRAISQP